MALVRGGALPGIKITMKAKTIPVTFGTTRVENVKVFYRQAGHPRSPAILLLHGFPTSSHMFRDLIPLLADEYHVVAPDLPGAKEIQLDLILDYRTNPALYPRFQKYFREHRPPTLAVWGKNDPHFLPAGAEAYRRDNPSAKVVLYDAGHFARETHAREIGAEIGAFLKGVFTKASRTATSP